MTAQPESWTPRPDERRGAERRTAAERDSGMRIEGATIVLERRGALACLDMAVAFAHRHLSDLLRIYLTVAVPVVAAVWWTAREWGWDLRAALTLTWFAAPFLGTAVTAGAASAAFGGPFLVRFWPHVRRDVLQAALAWWALRLMVLAGPLTWMFGPQDGRWPIGFVLIVVPGLLPGLLLLQRRGFALEAAALDPVDPGVGSSKGRAKGKGKSREDERAKAKVEDETAATAITTWTAGTLLFVVLAATGDALSEMLLGTGLLPELFGEDDSTGPGPSAWITAPGTLALLAACWLAVTVFVRLAWLFAYVDVRIRRDLWDLELQFVQEARRLETMR